MIINSEYISQIIIINNNPKIFRLPIPNIHDTENIQRHVPTDKKLPKMVDI